MASNETNQINPLTFVEGKFKWLGDFELLKRFVETILNIKGKWKVPRGSCKELKTADITVRWYENGSLLIQGSMMEEYKGILQKIATIKPNCECDLVIDNLVDFTPPQKPSLKNINEFMINANLTCVGLAEVQGSYGDSTTSLFENDMTNSAEVCRGERPSSTKGDLPCDAVICDELSDYEGINIEVDKLELANSAEQVPNTFTMKIINRLEEKIENLSCDVNCKINALSRDINDSREIERQLYVSRQNELQSENLLLKEENKALKERLTNLSYIMSDLNTKVKDCENEKLSLVTAIKIIQADNQHAMDSERGWQIQKDKRKSKQATGNICLDTREIETRNQYTVLSDSDDEGVFQCDDSGPSYANKNAIIVDPSPKPSGIPPKNRVEKRLLSNRKSSETESHHWNTNYTRNTDTRNTGTRNTGTRNTDTRNADTRNSDIRNTGTGNTDTRNSDTRNTGTRNTDTRNTDTRNTDTRNSNIRNTGSRNIPARSQSRVVILGDSMIKHLNPRQLQNGINCKVAIKTFSGAGIDDMFHYVRPTVSTRPDEIILHIGTNDLKNKSPETFARSVVNLGNSIKRENNEIKLTLSSIINRSDDAFLEEKVKQYNELLVDLCSTNKWDFIDNNNINHSHLNNYGLHLNRKGTGALAKNIKHYLINN